MAPLVGFSSVRYLSSLSLSILYVCVCVCVCVCVSVCVCVCNTLELNVVHGAARGLQQRPVPAFRVEGLWLLVSEVTLV